MVRPQTDWIVRKRDGRISPFDLGRIGRAMENAFRAELNLAAQQPLDEEQVQTIRLIADEVAQQIAPKASTPQGVEVEEVQDAVEILLMKHGLYRVARKYIVYRAEHAKLRALRGEEGMAYEVDERTQICVTLEDGVRVPFDPERIRQRLTQACEGCEALCSVDDLQEEV
ncbi:MAG: ribonucleoside-diphosphate reductase subunit alpha, partial [Planctomycetaceae bacterium]|nr:ribonucleoside-diphosphate reductase subunit alpha [Planctomycetaceae bacterium]